MELYMQHLAYKFVHLFIKCERLSLRMLLSLMWMVHTLNINGKSYWIRMLLLHSCIVQHTHLVDGKLFQMEPGKA